MRRVTIQLPPGPDATLVTSLRNFAGSLLAEGEELIEQADAAPANAYSVSVYVGL